MRAAFLLALAACNGSMEKYFAQDVVEIVENVPYVAGTANPRQELDLYLPRAVDNFPVVVFIHGGFWIHQDKNYFEPIVGLYHNVGIALARRGIGTAVINYRLVPDVDFDAQFDDCARAIAWVHDHIAEHRGDPEAIVVAGHSAGGHITALAAFDDARLTASGVDVTAIKGYAPLSPILDLAQMAASSQEDADIAAEVFGPDLAPDSPSTHFKATVAPLLFVIGDRDLAFVLAQVPAAITTLESLGAPVTFQEVPGKTHDDIVVDFDTDADLVSPLLAAFVHTVTH